MAVTDDIAKIEAAMSSGVRSVTYSDGRRVEYRDYPDMQKELARLQAKQRAASGQPSVTTSVGAFYRG